MGGRRWRPPPFPRRTARFCHAAGSFLPIPPIPPRFADSSVQPLLLTLCPGFEREVIAMIRRYRVWACAAGFVLLGGVAPARAVEIIGQQGTPVAAPACASGGQGCLGGKCPCFPALTDKPPRVKLQTDQCRPVCDPCGLPNFGYHPRCWSLWPGPSQCPVPWAPHVEYRGPTPRIDSSHQGRTTNQPSLLPKPRQENAAPRPQPGDPRK
jgi:hypothetical protein